MTDLAARAAAPTVYAPASSSDVLADALGRIITGRPLPEALRPVEQVTTAPRTVEEGLSRILAGPAR